MKNRLPALMVVCVLGVASSQSQPRPNIRQDFVLTDKEAIGMLAPRIVCGGDTEDLAWSPDGAFLAVRRIDPSSYEGAVKELLLAGRRQLPPDSITRHEVVFYAATSGKTTTVPFGGAGFQWLGMEWLKGSSQIALSYTQRVTDEQNRIVGRETSAVLLGPDGRVKLLRRNASEGDIEVLPSPAAPIVAVFEGPSYGASPVNAMPVEPTEPAKLTIYHSDGSPFPAIALATPRPNFVWGAEGQAYLRNVRPKTNGRGVDVFWQRIDLATGKTIPSTKPPVFAPVARRIGDFQVQDVTFKVPGGQAGFPSKHGVYASSLSKTEPADMLVTSDGTKGSLSPRGDQIAYVSQGITLVRPLIRVPKDLYVAMRNAEIRHDLLTRAKEVGLSLIMLASDSDNILPTQGMDWRSQVDPYLQDKSIYDGFQYSFPGGDMTKSGNPSSTVIGFFSGPGGKAVVYLDGHAVWQDNP